MVKPKLYFVNINYFITNYLANENRIIVVLKISWKQYSNYFSTEIDVILMHVNDRSVT